MYCRAEETVSLNIFFQLALNRITLVSIYPVCWSCPSHNSPCLWPMTCGTCWQTWIPKLKPNSWAPRQSSADSARQAPSGSTRWGDERSALRFHRLRAVVISVNWLCVASAGGQQGCVWDVRGSRSSGEDTGSRSSSETVFQPSVLLCRRRGTIECHPFAGKDHQPYSISWSHIISDVDPDEQKPLTFQTGGLVSFNIQYSHFFASWLEKTVFI